MTREQDPYPKPATAREAAKSLVRVAFTRGQTPEELIAGQYGLYRPDHNAVVGKVFGANPPRRIESDEIGVIGFDARHRGEVFAIAELWQEVAREHAEPPLQATLFDQAAGEGASGIRPALGAARENASTRHRR